MMKKQENIFLSGNSLNLFIKSEKGMMYHVVFTSRMMKQNTILPFTLFFISRKMKGTGMLLMKTNFMLFNL